MKRGRKPKCPYCGDTHTISKGVRKTATIGTRRLRVCKGCQRKFTVGRRMPSAQPRAGAVSVHQVRHASTIAAIEASAGTSNASL